MLRSGFDKQVYTVYLSSIFLSIEKQKNAFNFLKKKNAVEIAAELLKYRRQFFADEDLC